MNINITYLLPGQFYSSSSIIRTHAMLIGGYEAHVQFWGDVVNVYVWGADGLPTRKQIERAVKRLEKARAA